MRISTSLINQLAVKGILDQQAELSQIQNRISTGKRILSPSDDPSGSARVVRLTQSIQLTEQFIQNGIKVLNRQTLEESVLASVENSLLRVRELTLQANSSTLTDTDRQAIAVEIRNRADELLGLANTQDANGEYLFSGFQVNQKPFSRQANGTYTYNADQGQRLIQVSTERQIADSDSGLKVFMDIINGNGTFQVRHNTANTGTGVIDPGVVIDNASYVAETYTITFVTNGNGNLGYNVVGGTSGQLIPALPQNPVTDAPDFVSEAAINFNGIETSITGTPAVGDRFTVIPSTKQDVFTTVSDLATALETNTETEADVAEILNITTRSIQDIDQAFDHMTKFRAVAGARLNTVEDQQQVNESFLIELKATLSDTQDLDVISAVTELQSRASALEASQASFVRIQSLTVFDFL